MYKALLADDESSVLETLSNTICWQQFGVDALFTASDGCQALEIMSAHPVDLLITDIKMPKMDGLTLLKEVRALYPQTHCILLTAYSEFEYARTAIQLGVENYLLKPLNTAELESTIEKALNNIYASQKASRELFENNLLFRWAVGSLTGSELSERASLLNINLYLSNYCVVRVEKKRPFQMMPDYCQACTGQLEGTCEVYLFKDDQDHIFFIIGGSRIQPEFLHAVFSREASRMGLSDSIVFSVGSVVKNAEQLPISYQSTRRMHILSFREITPGLTSPEPDMKESEIDLLAQKLNRLFQEKEDTRQEHFAALAQDLFLRSKTIPAPAVQNFLTQAIDRLFAQEFPAHPETLELLHNQIRLFHARTESQNLSVNLTDQLSHASLLYSYYHNQLSPIIQSAIQYIHKHYAEAISIQELCQKYKMSAPYLGYLFKKETGDFFNNYLTRYRICSSIPLLIDTDLSINDIAARVGFSYSGYYITCFRKQTGMSPAKYRSTQF